LDAEALAGKISDWYQEVNGRDLARDGLLESPLVRLEAINRPAIDWLAERGVDLRGGDLLELAPAAQHFQGGVRIRQRGDTTLPGLFAAGETAGGQHGANRPGGNALLDGQVFGRIAGEEAAAWAEAHPPGRSVEVDGALRFLHSLDTADALPASEVRARLGELMDLQAGVVRTPAGLEAGLEDLQRLKEAGIRADGKGLAYAVEAFNLLQVAEMVLMAARAREESRGPHLLFGQFGNLTPLPGGEERWHRYLVIRKVGPDQEMKLEAQEPITTGNSLT
jgi:succinate dehydrogenase / fumarate reductase flavoprotein subunit